MTKPIVIANARVVDPATNRDAPGAVLVENGKITGITNGAPQGIPDGAETYDAKGQIVAPGLIDMRVFTGVVSGISTKLVTPPAAAASAALARVSRYSWPGSPVKTRMSMRPGATIWPLAS